MQRTWVLELRATSLARKDGLSIIAGRRPLAKLEKPIALKIDRHRRLSRPHRKQFNLTWVLGLHATPPARQDELSMIARRRPLAKLEKPIALQDASLIDTRCAPPTRGAPCPTGSKPQADGTAPPCIQDMMRAANSF